MNTPGINLPVTSTAVLPQGAGATTRLSSLDAPIFELLAQAQTRFMADHDPRAALCKLAPAALAMVGGKELCIVFIAHGEDGSPRLEPLTTLHESEAPQPWVNDHPAGSSWEAMLAVGREAIARKEMRHGDPSLVLGWPIFSGGIVVGALCCSGAGMLIPDEATLTQLTKLLDVCGAILEAHRRNLQRNDVEGRLRIATNLIPQLIWSTKPDGWLTWVNDRYIEYTGIPLEELLGDGWSQTLHPADRQHTMEVWRAATSAAELYSVECRMRGADGEYRWFLARGLPLRDAGGRIVEYFGADTDIHDRKVAEEALQRNHALLSALSHAQLRFIADAGPGPVFDELMPALRSLSNSDAAAIVQTKQEAEGVQHVMLASSGHVEALAEMGRVFFLSLENGPSPSSPCVLGGPPGLAWHWLLPLQTGDQLMGVIVLSRLTAGAGFDADLASEMQPLALTCTQILLADRNDRRRRTAEAQAMTARGELAHASRVMTMSQLMVSIAHEINQPLTSVVSNGNACLRWLGRDPPDLEEARDSVRRIVRDGKRAGEVIRRTRELVRKAPSDTTRFDVGALIADVLAIVQPELVRSHIEVETSLTAGEVWARGDRVQIQQVLLNLMVNAVDAIREANPPRGRLRVRCETVGKDSVRIEVRDNGIGFASDRAEQLFRPFQSTKVNGLGLGLSISRSIIQAHGGRLRARSAPGEGSAFEFNLPLDAPEP